MLQTFGKYDFNMYGEFQVEEAFLGPRRRRQHATVSQYQF